MQDHTPITTSAFDGLYDRSLPVDVPFKNLLSARNIKYEDGMFETREGSVIDFSLPNILHMDEYRPEGQAPRTIVLTASGDFYDATVSLVTPIATVSGATGFAAVTLNDKFYISPHNRDKGLAGASLIVYDGATARDAGGFPPVSALVATDSGLPGNVEAGMHIFRVAFETDTGFITGLGPATELNAVGSQTVALTNIPLGPVGTVKRHIFATKVITEYDGDVANQEYFFVPFGSINDNVTTTAEVNFFDADLIESADYLLDVLDVIPAGLGLRVYKGQLVLWGENVNPDYFRVSEVDDPETFNSFEGLKRVGPDGEGPIRNIAVFRSQLIICKSGRSYVTQANGERCLYWQVDDLDLGRGTECYGIATIESKEGTNTEDVCVIATQAGVYGFIGTFADKMEFTWKIKKIWDRVNRQAFNTIQTLVDVERKRVYVAVPLDSATVPNRILYADFSNGYNAEGVRWSIWDFPIDCRTILISENFLTKRTVFKFASSNAYRLEDSVRTDFSNAIAWDARFAYTQSGYPGQACNFAGVRLLANGDGPLSWTVYTLNDARQIFPLASTLAAITEFYTARKFNMVTEKCSVKISQGSPNNWARISSYTIFAKPVWSEFPNE